MFEPAPADIPCAVPVPNRQLLCFAADRCLTIVLDGRECTLDDTAMAQAFCLLSDYVERGRSDALVLSVGRQRFLLCREQLLSLHGHLGRLVAASFDAWSDRYRLH
jgi:hypothetical protein